MSAKAIHLRKQADLYLEASAKFLAKGKLDIRVAAFPGVHTNWQRSVFGEHLAAASIVTVAGVTYRFSWFVSNQSDRWLTGRVTGRWERNPEQGQVEWRRYSYRVGGTDRFEVW